MQSIEFYQNNITYIDTYNTRQYTNIQRIYQVKSKAKFALKIAQENKHNNYYFNVNSHQLTNPSISFVRAYFTPQTH